MRNINKIIREEINRFIINENISSLTQFATNLNNALNAYGREMGNLNTNSLNSDLKKYFKNFEIYVVQIIHAINRCVQSNSLNEGLGSWGIEIPAELGGNFWNDARRGFYNTKNFLTRGGNSISASNANGTVNQNAVPSVKLSILLGQLQNKQQEYGVKNSQYGIDRMVQQPRNILQNILPNLQITYNNLVTAQQQQQQNAQGQNP